MVLLAKQRSLLLCRIGLLLALPVMVCGMAASGCSRAGGTSQEKELRNAFDDRSGFDPNKLTPSQRAGYEAAMKGANAPPPSAPKAQGAAPGSAPGAPK